MVKRCFNSLNHRRGISQRTNKSARSYMATIQLAAALSWLGSSLSNAPEGRGIA
ncbi:hypothetical protein [Zafaria cholistanensis]|uniref:hypothetical protein n=1 Tax=Zafaria cholistanensis TaxID=1682741 RepID=UPI001CEC0F0A|nr:hypothetical protein [Zafaria cholistanensis]